MTYCIIARNAEIDGDPTTGRIIMIEGGHMLTVDPMGLLSDDECVEYRDELVRRLRAGQAALYPEVRQPSPKSAPNEE